MISLGSVVQLKSGGPRMTVVASHTISGWSTVKAWCCEWFDGTELREWRGPVHALAEVPITPTSPACLCAISRDCPVHGCWG